MLVKLINEFLFIYIYFFLTTILTSSFDRFTNLFLYNNFDGYKYEDMFLQIILKGVI